MTDSETAAAPPATKELPRENLVSCLRTIAMVDRTTYQHHEERPRDGKRPEEAGGTIWLTPREIALRLLDAMGENTDALYSPFKEGGGL
jgi:hypothetical protein